MKIGFIADFFSSQIVGGAELNDNVLISFLEKKFGKITKLLSSRCTLQDIKKLDYLIISNFTGLDPVKLKYITYNKSYIIYEHDHKYVSTRDPSKFKDFKIPIENLVNIDFYRNAKKVVCLSSIQTKILKESAGLDNCISISTSLWHPEILKYINELDKTKNGKAAIVDSKNPIKNTAAAERYCKANNIKYDLISSGNTKEFLKMLSEYEYLVFFPGVLESLCRLVVEAKMLNCKIITRKGLLGAGYEEWFELSGPPLVEKMAENITKALILFEKIILEDSPEHREEKITVILNCYRRPEYLKEQIKAIKDQTKEPHEIWVWVNYHEDNRDYDFDNLDVDRVFKNNYNWKYFGRFSAAMLAKTKYIALFDDDTIPGTKWFENCIDSMNTKEGIMGGAGVVLKHDIYQDHNRFGWSSKNKEIVEVDLVGHAWFFKKEWLKYLWIEEPLTWENGEDIHFAYTAQKHGKIKSYCPPHPENEIEKHSSLKGYQYGVDDKASSATRNHQIFYKQRNDIVKHAIENGWKILKNR